MQAEAAGKVTMGALMGAYKATRSINQAAKATPGNAGNAELPHNVSTTWPVQAEAAGKVAMGALTGAYEATRFKNKPPKAHLESLAVLGVGAGAEAAIKRAAALARGNILARCGSGLRAVG